MTYEEFGKLATLRLAATTPELQKQANDLFNFAGNTLGTMLLVPPAAAMGLGILMQFRKQEADIHRLRQEQKFKPIMEKIRELKGNVDKTYVG